jgi:hypothetical protein
MISCWIKRLGDYITNHTIAHAFFETQGEVFDYGITKLVEAVLTFLW